MKHLLPNFNINIALKTIGISQLFSRSSKSKPPPLFEKSDWNYHFVRECGEDYIGMCLRPLHHRIREHQQPCRGGEVFFHKIHCAEYKKQLTKVKKDNSYQYLKPAKITTLVNEHFQSHFKILTYNFKNYFDRIYTEAYYIKTMNPSLNTQTRIN